METQSNQKTILIVDDVASDRLLLKYILQDRFHVLEAADGRAALEVLDRAPAMDIVLTDIRMPVMDGFALLRSIGENKRLSAVPVIVITAAGDRETRTEALKAGAVDVLTKPYDPETTLQRIDNLLCVISQREAEAQAARRLLEGQMLRQREYDALTGLYNREGFYRYARQCLDAHPGVPYLLVRVDLDRFKAFNDTYGRAAGDALLSAIGSIHCPLQSGELVLCRLDADHIVGLVPKASYDPEARARARAAWLDGYPTDFRLSASSGVYEIVDPSLDISLMCDRALMALQTVKSRYAGKIGYYDDALRLRLLDEQTLTGEMDAALAGGQFLVYFQPLVNYDSGALIGAEALVRWQHPTRGLLFPGAFVPLFEKNGFISKLDEYVWNESCRYMRKWLDQEGKLLPVSVSVNISRVDIQDLQVCRRLKRLVERYRLPPSALRLEITESVYTQDSKQLIAAVKQFKQLGFTVEMDDFGSGYSSLNMLKDVPVDLLKIDMRFLSVSEDEGKSGNILASVIRMAHNIDLPVIAEGVETKEQADYLKSAGCRYMQGYYFARPMPPEEFEALLGRWTVDASNVMLRGSEDGAREFFDAGTPTSLLFGSYIGGAGIVEYRDGRMTALRLNDQWFAALGTDREAYPLKRLSLDRLVPDSRAAFQSMLETAVRTGEEACCETCSFPLQVGRNPIWLHCRVRRLARKVDGYLLFLSIENIGERKRLQAENARLKKRLAEAGADPAAPDAWAGMDAVIRNIPAGLAVFKIENGRALRIYLSDRAYQVLGYSPEDIPPLQVEESLSRVHPEDLPVLRKAIGLAISQCKPLNQDIRVLAKSGGLRYVNLSANPLLSEAGELYFYGVYSDVTAERESRKALAYQRVSLFQALSTAYSLVIASNLTKNSYNMLEYASFINKTAPEQGAYDQLIEDGMSTLPEEERGGFYNAFARESLLSAFAAGQSAVRLEHRQYAGDRSACHWMETTALKVNNPYDGDVLCIAVARSIDLQRENEEKLQQALEITSGRLAERLHYGSLIDSVANGLVMVSYPGTGLPPFFIGNLLRSYGYSDRETADFTSGDLFGLTCPEDRGWLQARREALQKAMPDRYDLEYRVLKKDGSTAWVSVHATKFTDDKGDGYARIYLDNTEAHALMDRLRIREEEIRLTMAKMGKMICYYDVATSTLTLPKLYAQQRGFPEVVANYPECLKTSRHVTAKDGTETTVAAYYDAIRRGEPSGVCETHFVDQSGRESWERLEFVNIFDGDGKPVRAVIAAEDVTDRHAEAVETLRLRRSAEMLQIVASHSARIVYYYDFATEQAKTLDKAAAARNGLPEICKNPPDDMLNEQSVFPESRAGLRDLFARIHRGEGAGDMKLHMRGTDGRERWYDLRFSDIPGEEGAVLSFLDVTDRHMQEVAYARYRQSIDETNAGPCLFFETDLTADLVEKQGGDMLPAALHAAGRSHTEAIAYILLHYLPGSCREQAREYFSRSRLLSLFAGGTGRLTDDWQAVSKTGEPRYVRVSLQMVTDPYTGHVRALTIITDVTAEKAALLSVQRRAELDGMTGVYNRATGESLINQALEKPGKGGAFLLLDLDDLKTLNDTLGHGQGDAALKAIASEMKKHFRHSDLIARVGGDEFCAYLPGMTEEAALRASLSALLRRLGSVTVGNGPGRALRCSVGAAVSRPGSDAFDSLYKRADLALYHVKRNGKNDYAFFEPGMRKEGYRYTPRGGAPSGDDGKQRDD